MFGREIGTIHFHCEWRFQIVNYSRCLGRLRCKTAIRCAGGAGCCGERRAPIRSTIRPMIWKTEWRTAGDFPPA